MWYWLYGRLDVNVAASDDELMSRLNEYANEHVKGGSTVLTDEMRDFVRAEHEGARELFLAVASGRL